MCLQFKNKCTLFLRRTSFLLTLYSVCMFQSRGCILNFFSLLSRSCHRYISPFPFLQPTDSQLCLKCRLEQPSSLKMADWWKRTGTQRQALFFFSSPFLFSFFFFNPLNASYCIFPLYCTSSFKTKTLHLASAMGYPCFKSQTNVLFHFLYRAVKKKGLCYGCVANILNFKAKTSSGYLFPQPYKKHCEHPSRFREKGTEVHK